ncbi:MAG: hypothetical protein VYB86_01615, partial [Candidatus Thermoplasmatota archaeon]|nr:hypothetical protein [Candidatus Thermoplasmatota archaeon]
MNVMRHLRVPNSKVEGVLAQMKAEQWLAIGFRVIPDEDGTHRLLPISTEAPSELPGLTSAYEVELVEGRADERPSSDWWKHLKEILGEEEVALHG